MSASVCAWLYFSAYQDEHDRSRENAAAYKAEYTDQSAEICGAVLPEQGILAWLSCVVGAATVDLDGGYIEADIKAQQDMAEWALGMLFISLFALLFTVVGVFLVWRTLHFTRETLREAKGATEAANEAAKAASNANKFSEILGKAQIRAYPAVAFESFTLTYGNRHLLLEANATLKVRNVGSTPAVGMYVLLSTVDIRRIGGSDIAGLMTNAHITVDLAQDAEEKYDISFWYDICKDVDWSWINGEAEASIRVECRFMDIFDEIQVQNFLFEGPIKRVDDRNAQLDLKQTMAPAR